MSRYFTEHYREFQEFRDSLATYESKGAEEETLLDLLKAAMSAVMFNREEYDVLTPYSAARQGATLIEEIRRPRTAESLSRVLKFLAGFIREATLVRQDRTGSEQKVLDHFLEAAAPGREDEWGSYLSDYLRYVLPAKLIETKYRDIGQLRSEVESLHEKAYQKTDAIELRIEGYRGELKKLESDYNFVGLSHAFRSLEERKAQEKNAQQWAMLSLGLLALLVPVLFFFVSFEESLISRVLSSAWSPVALTKLLAAIGIEVIVLYFFRISLKAYLLTRSQITNLQLRMGLCSFIEGYLEFASKAASNSKGGLALAGFESLIFSGLPSEGPTIPATLEGLEQVASIVNSVRPPSKAG